MSMTIVSLLRRIPTTILFLILLLSWNHKVDRRNRSDDVVVVVLVAEAFGSSSASSSFRAFQFAPNGVCVQPKYFVEHLPQNHQQDDRPRLRYFTMKNVLGEGDCMFLAVALAAMTSMGLGGNDALLRAISRETRDIVASVFESEGNLVIEGKRLVPARTLLKSAAQKEGVAPERYLELLRKEGIDGGLYGGGPELAVLANVLRRPISIYELADDPVQNDGYDTKTANDEGKDDGENQQQHQSIVCVGTFGESTFHDPLDAVPNSAVLSMNDVLPGAYSWHLHILVVDVSSKKEEKHACVLLPQHQQER